ncbi:hypothetical protein [Piscinibacter sakaiensis]|uniref:hypothetical protein n=1 Tax=Piscinibacter sakaiensis TaxID=1547922 RepID=UPI003AAB14E6
MSRSLGVAAASALAAGTALAQASGDTGGIVLRPAEARLSIERLELPKNEGMTLVGTSYTVDVGGGLAFGPAIFGAASGERGGLFSLGGELSWRQRIAGPLKAEIGFYAGGGGGGNLAVRDGLVTRPHLDLLYDFGAYNVGISWSRVRFVGTPLDSRQVGLVLSTNTTFGYVPRDRMNAPLASIGRPGAGFDRMQAVIGVYQPRGNNTRASGGKLPDSLGYAGIRAERAFNGISYWGLEANVGAQGGVTGYAEYLATVGVESGIGDQTFTLGGRLALGMGGGGDVSTGGGLLGKAALYSAVRLTRDLAAGVEVGVTRAPQGNFKAVHGSASLMWIFDDAGNVFSPSRTTRMDFSAGIEQFDAGRRDGTTRPLKAVVLKGSRFLDRNLYVTGQAHSAYDGNAGGYAAGLFGFGWQTPLGGPTGPTWYAGLEALTGAGGGGGVDVRGGALVQGNAYVGFDIGPSSSLRFTVGKLRSQRGTVDATVADVALVFSFGLAGQGIR